MENKLQQLTQKLYDEGLEKGRAEADKLVADAKAEARKIVAEARAEAEEIVKKAEAKAEDVSKNTMTEISLAGRRQNQVGDRLADHRQGYGPGREGGRRGPGVHQGDARRRS